MMTDEARARVEKLIADHKAWEASPEGQNAARIEHEFNEAVKKLIEEKGVERTLWILAELMPRTTKANFVIGFNKHAEVMRNLKG